MASTAHKKKWEWPFAPDPRQEVADLSDDEVKTTDTEIKTRATKAQVRTTHASKWERFSEMFAEVARYQSQRLYRYLDRALDGPQAINLHSQFASVPEDDGIGAWIALLKWTSASTDPARARDQALNDYYGARLKSTEHPESLWTRIVIASKKLSTLHITLEDSAVERHFIKAIEESQEGRLYYHPIRAHQLAERQCKASTFTELEIALTFKYEEHETL